MISKETRFCVVGLGLLGGSYARGLKANGYRVDAIDINQESLDYALNQKWIDHASQNPCDLLSQADCIILGLYPSCVVDWIDKNQEFMKENTLITDVTGIKQKIVPVVQAMLRKDVEFIASHPMAGKEVSGVQHSDAAMFTLANFIITPTDRNSPRAIAFVQELGRLLNFDKISVLTLKEHDEMIGFLSQLTHVIAVTLMNTNDNSHLVDYTGDSFRDLTRIAKINENLWSELFLMNKTILLKEIDDFASELKHFRDTLDAENVDEMKRLFIQSTCRRKLFDK